MYITIDNQRRYAQEMKTIVKWVNKENTILRTEDALHVQACQNKCTKTLISQKSNSNRNICSYIKSEICVRNYYMGPTKHCHLFVYLPHVATLF